MSILVNVSGSPRRDKEENELEIWRNPSLGFHSFK
jgi:hypothetical protein